MLGKRLASPLRVSPSSQLSSVSNPVDEGKSRSLGCKAVSTVLICLTGGVGLSVVDDLAIYHGCSSKAMDTASNHKAMVDAIGEPITKGAWYNASLAVAHQRKSVSCSFPVSGPRGDGMLRLKAIRNGVMDAVLNIPANEESQRTMKIDLLDNLGSSECKACTRAQ
ncbi:hypothetical protein AKJ16_DCAP02394 [Drosera capensis]